MSSDIEKMRPRLGGMEMEMAERTCSRADVQTLSYNRAIRRHTVALPYEIVDDLENDEESEWREMERWR